MSFTEDRTMSLEQARERWLDQKVKGWTCSCGECTHPSGTVVAVEDEGGRLVAKVRDEGSSRDYDYSASITLLVEA